jgi:hypothetical protein
MVEFYCRRTGRSLDVGAVAGGMELNVDPARSRTFRSGGVGGWKTIFTPQHHMAIEEVAGGLLRRLGYGI